MSDLLQIQVKLFTKHIGNYNLSDELKNNVFLMPGNLTCAGLSEMLNQMLELSHEQLVKFDFVLHTHFREYLFNKGSLVDFLNETNSKGTNTHDNLELLGVESLLNIE